MQVSHSCVKVAFSLLCCPVDGVHVTLMFARSGGHLEHHTHISKSRYRHVCCDSFRRLFKAW
jgi:hypothetical protein